MNIFYASFLALTATLANGSSHSSLRASKRQMQAVFPPYNQQCRDDAGPLFIDDAENFGNKKYHEGKPAFAVGDCPDALKGACSQKPKTAAFLEGPIDCGGKGWFCRIVEEPGWPGVALDSDRNFGHCNTTAAVEDPGFDGAGHCHGSDSDDTFYWWVRDHWHRQYNGRLRCCCGWNDLTEGSIVNRCDHRRLVTPEENLESCRDANEEGSSPYNGGCKQDKAPALNQPIPEDDSKCWEVQKFGEPNDDGSGGGGDQTGDNNEGTNPGGENEGDEEEPETDGSGDGNNGNGNEEEEEEENDPNCMDDASFRFRGKANWNCAWVATRADRICPKKYGGKNVFESCPMACGECW